MTLLQHLTGGIIEKLGDLTIDNINEIVGAKIDSGNLAPLFYGDGSPILKDDGKQLILPYTHASVFARHIAGLCLGQSEGFTLQNTKDLPVPHWQSVHTFVASNDGYVLLALRGNANKNALGKAVHTASGKPAVLEGGEAAETVQENLIRNLFEETNLHFEDIGGLQSLIKLPGIQDGPLDSYKINTSEGKITGIIPTVVTAYGIKSHLDKDQMTYILMKSDLTSVGFISARLSDMDRIGKVADAEIQAGFHPSPALEQILPGITELVAATGSLEVLQQALAETDAKLPADKFSLEWEIPVAMTAQDFTVPGGQHVRMMVQLAEAIKEEINPVVAPASRMPSGP